MLVKKKQVFHASSKLTVKSGHYAIPAYSAMFINESQINCDNISQRTNHLPIPTQ